MARQSQPVDRAHPALVSMPHHATRPLRQLARRGVIAMGLLVAITLVVYLDGSSYADNTGEAGLTFIDALYYAAVTMTTTGYGDIVPVTQHARLLNAILITPLRVAFLILLVGTTIEVLANQGTRIIRDLRWRRRMRNHIVVIGYGTKGRSAVKTLRRSGTLAERIVVLDSKPAAVSEANLDGIAAFRGDGTRRDLLRRAEIANADRIIICLDRDDAAILATLTARELNPTAPVVVSVREGENARLVRQSGATSVITSSATVGRLMGLATLGPDLGALIQDILTSGTGLELVQREAAPDEVGVDPATLPGERVIGIVRGGVLRRFYDSAVDQIKAGDHLIVVRRSTAAPEPADDDDEDLD